MRAEFPSGNVPTTRVRLRISRFSRSMALFVRILLQWAAGNLVYVRVSAQPSRAAFAAPSSLMDSSSSATSAAFLSDAPRDSMAWIASSIAATPGRFDLGTLARTFRQKCAVRRWWAAPGKTSAIEPAMPAALSPVNVRTPRRPRDLGHERNSRQHSADSARPSAAPMTSR